MIKWTTFGSNSKDWSPRDRTERARLMKPLRTPALTPAIGPQPAIRTQKPLFLRQRGMPRFPSVGVSDFWGDRPVSIRGQRVHSARYRPLHHDRHRCCAYRAIALMLSYTAASKPAAVACDAGPLLRRLASPAKPGCAVRGVSSREEKSLRPRGGRDEFAAARRSSLVSSVKWMRTTIERINSALPCRVGHRGMDPPQRCS